MFYISISIDGKKLPSGCCWQVFAYLIYACSLTTLDGGDAGMGDKLNRLLACLADLILFSTYKHTHIHTNTNTSIYVHRHPLTHKHLLLERLTIINDSLFSTLLNSLPTHCPYNNANQLRFVCLRQIASQLYLVVIRPPQRIHHQSLCHPYIPSSYTLQRSISLRCLNPILSHAKLLKPVCDHSSLFDQKVYNYN